VWLVFVGSDGSGKSTVAERLESRCAQQGKKLELFHWRPEILPSPERLLGRKISPHDATQPHAYPPRSRFISLLLRVYYLVDFWLGYFYRVKPALKRPNSVVLFERFYYDVIFDPKRYRLHQDVAVSRLLCSLAPRPDYIIALLGPPNVIHDRKKELTVTEIERQQKLIRVHFGSRPNVLWFDPAAVNADEIAARICESISSKDERTPP